MNAEVLIKARKVFVNDNIVEYSESCPHCELKGLDQKLRYFYLSLEEAIYKCENSKCLYPFKQFIFKSLADNTVYYYEEVIDGGRDAYLRIPLDDQNAYESKNPISTKLICDSQRHPDIEDYSFDFSNLLDDVETEAKPQAPVENFDFLDFLDETPPIPENVNPDQFLDGTGLDSFIDNLLSDTPVKSSPVKLAPVSSQNSQKTSRPKAKTEAKLSKCIQHIEKVKSAKNKNSRENSPRTFASTIKKVRKNQSKLQAPSKEDEGETEPVSNANPNRMPPPPRPSEMAAFLKSANNLRPTELATKLRNLNMYKIDSKFLRDYMKTKESKLFANEPSNPQKSNATNEMVKKATVISNSPKVNSRNPHLNPYIPKVNESLTKPIVAAHIDDQGAASTDVSQNAHSAGKKKATPKPRAPRKSSKKVAIKEEPLAEAPVVENESVVKKVRKPRTKKPIQAVDTNASNLKKEPLEESPKVADSNETNSETGTNKPSTRRKATRKNLVTPPNLTEAENVIKPEAKKNNRKQKSSPVENNEALPEKSPRNESVARDRRSQKGTTTTKVTTNKCDSDEPKPKRKRATKPKVVAIKVEQQPLPSSSSTSPMLSLPSLLDDDSENRNSVDSQKRPTTVTASPEQIVKRPKPCEPVELIRLSTETDSESNSEPLLGFPSNQKNNAESENTSNDVLMAMETSNLNEANVTTSTENPPKMRLAEKKPQEVRRKKILILTETDPDETIKPSPKRPRRGQTSVLNKREPKIKKSTQKNLPSSSNSESESVLITVYVDSSSCKSEAPESDEISESNEINKENKNNVDENAMSLPKQEPIHQDVNQVTTSYITNAEKVEAPCIDLDSDHNQKSIESQTYYRRKTFKKEKDQGFQIDALLGEWNDSDSEHLENQKHVNKVSLPQSTEHQEIDDTASEKSVISIRSETSDSSIAFVAGSHI